ncbi:hypothetical protein FRC07_002224 [Ceratobasidium sp. 392]|nr:hypothetical protein FRC07_002224 [Ceratobasidium sp. 392]
MPPKRVKPHPGHLPGKRKETTTDDCAGSPESNRGAPTSMPKSTPGPNVPAPVAGASRSTDNNAAPAITVAPGVKPPAIQQPRGTGTWNKLPAPTVSSSSPVPPTPTPCVANGGQARKHGEPERDNNAPATARPKHQRTTSAKPLSAVQVTERADPVGAAGSKKAEVSDDKVKLTGVEPAPDLDRLTPAEVKEVIAAWEKSVCDVQSQVMAASVQDKQLAQDLDHAYLGSAYIRFIGLGDVFGVVDLEADPNRRGNPRGLNEGHVRLL